MTAASALIPLWNRAAEWDRRLAMVQQARSFLYLSTYYVEYDAYGTAMLSALIAAQRRGVAVNLLIDALRAAPGRRADVTPRTGRRWRLCWTNCSVRAGSSPPIGRGTSPSSGWAAAST